METAPTAHDHEIATRPLSAVERRNTSVDLARTIAAWGVVTLHVPWGTPEGKILNQIFWVTCVPFFYTAGLIFFIRSLKVQELKLTFKKLGNRLIIPYLSWTIIYLILLQLKATLVHKERSIDWLGALLYGQSSVHLYFVPVLFFFLVLAMAYAAMRSVESRIIPQGWMLFFAGISYFIVGYLRGYYGKESAGYFAAIIIYLIASHCIASLLKSQVLNKKWAMLGLTLWILAVALNIQGIRLTFFNCPLLLPIGGIGFCLFALGDWVKIKSRAVINLLSASYGIYLSHVLFLEMIEFGISRMADDHFRYSFVMKVGLTSFIFLAALIFTLLIRKSHICSMLLLGETSSSSPHSRWASTNA